MVGSGGLFKKICFSPIFFFFFLKKEKQIARCLAYPVRARIQRSSVGEGLPCSEAEPTRPPSTGSLSVAGGTGPLAPPPLAPTRPSTSAVGAENTTVSRGYSYLNTSGGLRKETGPL